MSSVSFFDALNTQSSGNPYISITSQGLYDILEGSVPISYFSQDWANLADLNGLNSISGLRSLTSFGIGSQLAQLDPSGTADFKAKILAYISQAIADKINEVPGNNATAAQIQSLITSQHSEVLGYIETIFNNASGSSLADFATNSIRTGILADASLKDTLFSIYEDQVVGVPVNYQAFVSSLSSSYYSLMNNAITVNPQSIFPNITSHYSTPAAIETSIEGNINNFIGQFTSTKRLPATITDLDAQLGSYIAPTISSITSNNLTLADTTPSLSDYLKQAYVNLTGDNSDSGFKNAYGAFALTYPYDGTSAIGTTYTNVAQTPLVVYGTDENGFPLMKISDASAAVNKFMDNWLRFLAPIQPTTSLTSTTPDLVLGKDLYFQIYKAFNPDATGVTDPNFLSKYNDFVTSETNRNANNSGFAYFIPGQSFLNWFEKIQKDYQANPTALPFEEAAITNGTQSRKGAILDRVMRLLSNMVSSLQEIGSVQADQLTFYTDYQQIYNNLLKQIPTFTAGGEGFATGTSTEDITMRTLLNNQINATFSDRLSSYQNIVKDQAQRVQAQINTNSNAVSQQADAASALLQEVNALIRAIFKN